MPIGTEIHLHIHRIPGFISGVTIKSSMSDIGSTEGLCGYMSEYKNTVDDFKERYTRKVVDQKTFAKSWRYLNIIPHIKPRGL